MVPEEDVELVVPDDDEVVLEDEVELVVPELDSGGGWYV